MECLLTFFILLVVFTVATGSAARSRSRSASRRRTYQHLAKRYMGLYVPGGLLARPAVRIRYGQTEALLKEAPARAPLQKRGTLIQIDWPDAKFRVELFRDPGDDIPVTLQGARDLEIGVGEFDEAYVVRGRNEQDVAAFLSEGVRWQIERLRTFLDDGQLYLQVNRGRMIIQKQKLIRKFPELEQFVQHALELYDQALLTQAHGIEFVESDVAQPLDHVVCKVCGEEIRDSMVYCRRCKTPHHHDCWEYNGACSVYGCRETRHIAPQAITPLNKPHTSSHSARSS